MHIYTEYTKVYTKKIVVPTTRYISRAYMGGMRCNTHNSGIKVPRAGMLVLVPFW